MKIAFVGTECTGKSTMSKLLAEKLGLEHIPDPYMTAIKDGCLFPSNWKTVDPVVKWDFEKAMHQAQFKLEEGKDKFVADSASLVRAACGLYLCGQDAPQDELWQLVEHSFLHGYDYDVLIYLPQRFPYVDNGHRFMNQNIRNGIDHILRSMLKQLGTIKVIWSSSFSIENDLVYIMGIVKGYADTVSST